MAVGISGVEKLSSGGGGMVLEEEPTLVSLGSAELYLFSQMERSSSVVFS